MQELWIGVVEVLTEPSELSGDTRAFTNVVTWAASAVDFREKVTKVLEESGWDLLGAEDVRPVSRQSDYLPEIEEVIERAKRNPLACIYATFHYYPSARA